MLLLSISSKWPGNNLKIFSLPSNSGPSAARNLGLKKSLGEYIYFFDADDLIDKNALSELYKITKKFNCDKKLLQDKVMDITIDGLKRIYNDNSWLLLRPSGTEPLFRLYSDAMTQERADYLIVEAERIVSESIQENL